MFAKIELQELQLWCSWKKSFNATYFVKRLVLIMKCMGEISMTSQELFQRMLGN